MLIVSTERISGGRTPLLRGSVCAYHPATQGLNPKHNITLLQFIFELWFEKDKKEAGIGPFFNKQLISGLVHP